MARQTVRHLIATAHACIPGLQLDMLSGCDGDARLGCEDLRCEDELFLPILSESYVIAAPASSPWRGRTLTENSPLDDLASWIMCPTHASHQRLMPIYGAAANPAAHASSFSLALDLVAAEVGMAVVPASLAAEATGITTHPLDTLDLKRRVGLCYPVQSLEKRTLTLLRNALDIKTQIPLRESAFLP